MDEAFAQWIRTRLAEMNKSQKELAGRAHDEFLPHERIVVSTVETKLSKLLGGYSDGEDFFFTPDKPWRTESFAMALEVPL